MLYLIGLGLGDAKDVTVKGLEIIKSVDHVYLESYTSILGCPRDELESFYGRNDLILADRDFVEQDAQQMLDQAKEKDVAFLVVGDPLGATTHSDLLLRAHELGIKWKIIHNASIMNAVACCGLQLYSFGETVSIPFWTDTWKPESFFEKIIANMRHGLHTLCLLDIKVKERSLEAMMRGKTVYEPPRFMSVAIAAAQLLEIVKTRRDLPPEDGDTTKAEGDRLDSDIDLLNEKSICVGLARVGQENQRIIYCSLEDMAKSDLGPPLHSLVIPSQKTHPLEWDMLKAAASSFSNST